MRENVAVNRALQNFFAAIESDDSLFAAEAAGDAPAGGAPGVGAVYCGDFLLRFRDASLVNSRTLHFSLIEKLVELLKEAGSADSLVSSLCLSSPAATDKKPTGLALRMRRVTSRSPASSAARFRNGDVRPR